MGVRYGIVTAHPDRDPARVGVLDDRHARIGEVVDRAPRRVGVDVVVVRHLLAVQLARLGEARRPVRVGVEGRGLVRVLAVAEHRGPPQCLAGELGPHVLPRREFLGGPFGDGHVVLGDVGEGPRREPAALVEREAAVAQRGHHERVRQRVRHDGDARVVLGRGAHHGRAADIDLLDAGVDVRTRGDRFPERVQVAHQQVERFDTQLAELFHVCRQAQVREQAGVHLRVQRLHPSVEALREPGEVLHPRDRDPEGGDPRGRRTGRHDLHARLGQRAGQLVQAALVVDADKRAPNGTTVVHGIVTFLPVTVQPSRTIRPTYSTSWRRSASSWSTHA